MLWLSSIPAFCILKKGFNVDPLLLDTVLTNVNNAVGFDLVTSVPDCFEGANVIQYGATTSGASGTTNYEWRGEQTINVTVTIDTRVLQSCALFHNVALHEVLHTVLGPEHNDDPTSIMGMSVMINQHRQVIQDIPYMGLSSRDVLDLQRVYPVSAYTLYLTQVDKDEFRPKSRTATTYSSYEFPSLNPSSHVSGSNRYHTRDAISIPTSTLPRKYNYWLLKHWALKYKLKKEKDRSK